MFHSNATKNEYIFIQQFKHIEYTVIFFIVISIIMLVNQKVRYKNVIKSIYWRYNITVYIYYRTLIFLCKINE